MAYDDRYGEDALADLRGRRGPAKRIQLALEPGLVIEHTLTEFCGAVVAVRQGGLVELEDFDGMRRTFPLADGFMVEGKPVELQPPKAARSRRITASGGFAVPEARARVAQASRIFVEGRHDAELIEKVWGSDLRHEGIVVELLEGVDHLATALRDFAPAAGRRVGVLVDHLVAGSKETRLTEDAVRSYAEHVLVVGHPYVDVWQAVKPERLGLSRWPEVPRSVEWKAGICRALGLPHAEQADIADAWQRILGRVRDYRDLEPALSGQVERLINFVTLGER